jgi:O-antigen/teichoic acid export membrane protein
MKPKQVLTNTIWFGIIPQISTLISVLILPLITPYLTPFDYGVNGIINSYSGLFLTISVLGLNVHLTNSFYTHKKKFNLVWGRILAIILVSSAVFSLLYAIILVFSLKEITGIVKVITIIGACFPILFQANKILANHYYPLVYRPKPLVLRNLITSLIGVITTFVCIYFLRLGFLGWVISAAVTALVSFTIFIKPLWIDENILPIFSVKKERLKKWLLVSLPIILHTLGFVLLSSSDRIIMQTLGVSFDEIGLYSNGYQIGSYITIITSAMITAVSPKIQELFRGNNFKQLKSLYLFIQISTIIGIFLFSVWMPQIYRLLIRNAELQSASSIALIICFSSIVYPFYAFISTTAFIEERTPKLLWLVLFPSIINIILNFIFIPIYGYKAAVFTTLVSYWTQLIIPLFEKYFKEKTILIFGSKYFPLKLLGIFVIILIISQIIVKFSISIKIIISISFLIFYFLYIRKQKDF